MLPDYYYYYNYYNLIKFVKPILVKKLCKILKHILYLWLLIYVLLNLGVTFLVENENGKTMNMSIEKKTIFVIDSVSSEYTGQILFLKNYWKIIHSIA